MQVTAYADATNAVFALRRDTDPAIFSAPPATFTTSYTFNAVDNPDLYTDIYANLIRYTIVNGSLLKDGVAVTVVADGTVSRAMAAANNGYAATDWVGRILRAIASALLDQLNLIVGQVIGQATVVWDPPSIANGAGATSQNITVNGAQFGDVVDVGVSYSLAGIIAQGSISAANTVNIRIHNGTGSAVNLASGTWTVTVRRPVVIPQHTMLQVQSTIQNKVNANT